MLPPILPKIVIHLTIGHNHFHRETPRGNDGNDGNDGKAAITDAIDWLMEQFRLHFGFYGLGLRIR